MKMEDYLKEYSSGKYLTYLKNANYGDVFSRETYVDDGLSESVRYWAEHEFPEEVKEWVLGEAKSENYGLVRKPKETVDSYGNRRNEKGEIFW